MALVQQRLFIVRHAETQTVTADGRLHSDGMVALTERGRQQADVLGEWFAPTGVTRVHSSEQARAIETAERLGGPGATVIPHTGLREISLGDAEGAPAHEAFAGVPGYLVDPDIGMPGGETPRQVFARAGRAMDAVLGAEAGEPVVAFVGHGCVNRMLLAHLLKLELRFALRVRQDWTGVNVLERLDGEWQPGALNWNPGGLAEFARTRGVAGVAPEVWQRLGR